MDKQRNYNQPQGEIIGYKVDVVDGELRETPIYEQRPTPVATPTPLEDTRVIEWSHKLERVSNRTRGFRGKSLATFSLCVTGLTGIAYISDVASTYIQEQKIISPLEAYGDFTELPHLVGPLVDTIQTVTKITNS